jgi:hypothetical protein
METIRWGFQLPTFGRVGWYGSGGGRLAVGMGIKNLSQWLVISAAPNSSGFR